jgi:hypothetical protein
MAFVRGSNPIWFEVDLDANPFDDTFYLFVLQNDLPYLPATVWHYPDGTFPWNNPIQFLGNGTLPIDIYFQSDEVYRLEFRHGPTQSDPLIYLVEDYMPGGSGGNIPVEGIGLSSDNQITNPQFADVYFDQTLVKTSVTNPDPIQVGPGWELVLTGTGSVTLNQVPLNSTTPNPTNAPYALQIILTGGWSTADLRQRFNQNGMLWANKIVSSSITARIEGAPNTISAALFDSQGTELKEVLSATAIDSNFNEYLGYGLLDASTNTDTPPDAYIDYLLSLPVVVDIYVTSFQLISQNPQTEQPTVEYEQTTVERQIDHTFHNFKYSLLIQPKDSVLTAWNFALNPFQFKTTTVTATTSKCQYIADQTIIYTTGAAGAVNTGKSSLVSGVRQNLAIQSNATASNQFALIQYVAPQTIRQYWSYLMSSLVRAKLYTAAGTVIGIKARLIYRISLPPTISSTEPIASWGGPGTDPVFAAGWTAIIPVNDPTYQLSTSFDPIEGNQAFTAYPFNGFQMPTDSAAAQTLGIVIYTTNNMNNTGPFDSIAFDTISLVPNEFAIDTNPITYDETLSRCQFYYEKSKQDGVLLTAADSSSALLRLQTAKVVGSNVEFYINSFGIEFLNVKCKTPTVDLYSTDGTISNVVGNLRIAGGSVGGTPANIATSNFVQTDLGTKAVWYRANSAAAIYTVSSTNQATDGYILFHYGADARLGI